MFAANDLVIYSNLGVCRIVEITTQKFNGEDRLYYALIPLFQEQECTVYIPVDTKVFMRPVISRTEALALIDSIPLMQTEAFYCHSVQQLKEHYEQSFGSHDCSDLIELLMSIYAKKQYVLAHNRKVGQIDERFMKRAEDLLYGEFSVALDIPVKEVQQYIETRVKHLKTAQQQ